MASYVLKHSRVDVTGITSVTYSTITDILTVPTGHLYIIKGLSQFYNIASTGGAITGIGGAILATNASDANAALVSPLVYFTSAGAVTSGWAKLEFAAANAEPTATLGLMASSVVTAAITSNAVLGYRHGGMRDMHLEAGQVLEYRPYYASNANAAWAVTSSLSASMAFDISYIDYTL